VWCCCREGVYSVCRDELYTTVTSTMVETNWGKTDSQLPFLAFYEEMCDIKISLNWFDSYWKSGYMY
jgi:hypothetical protein